MRTCRDLLQIVNRKAQSDSACTESFGVCVGELVRTQLTQSYQLAAVQLWLFMPKASMVSRSSRAHAFGLLVIKH